MKYISKFMLPAFVAGFVLSGFCANAQNMADAQRLQQLEHRVMSMEKKMFSTSAVAGNTSMADFEVRLQNLESESSKVYGGVEELAHAVEQLAKKVELIAKDLDMRLQDLEAKMVESPLKNSAEVVNKSSSDNAVVNTDKNPVVEQSAIITNDSPEDVYKKAYNFLTAASYGKASEEFRLFIEKFPKHHLADNSHYWLGEIYLVENKPDQAVIAFSTGLKNFPQGNKAAANLLKMGVAFQRMGRGEHAQSSWKKLIKDFPKSPEAEKARQKLTNS